MSILDAPGVTLSSLTIALNTVTGLPSVSSLRDVDTRRYSQAETLGYTSAGDGGHCKYFFILSALPPADNGVTVLRSNDGRGYWAMIHDGTIDVKQAGASGSGDNSIAFNRLAAAILNDPSVHEVVFSPNPQGQYTIGGTQVIFARSNIIYRLNENIVNTSLVYRTPMIFANDGLAQPAANLENVTILGSFKSIKGNGAAILATMGLGPTQLPPTFPRPMFNYIRNLSVDHIIFDDGVYDSMQARQCQNHKFTFCIGKNASQYLANGFNITTNWTAHVNGDWATYGHGVVEDCLLIDNASVGGTYYHCSGGTFRRTKALFNGAKGGVSTGLFQGAGFSYESVPGAVSTEYADGLFDGCISNFSGLDGYYINTPGVIINETCSSLGNGLSGYASDVDSLHLNGVTVVGVDRVTVLGRHSKNARHGASFLGATGAKPEWEIGGEYSDNAGSALNIQGLWKATVLPGTRLFRNGKTSIGDKFSIALNVSNNAYNAGGGSLIACGLEFDGNGSLDILVTKVRRVHVANNESYNPNESRSDSNGVGFSFNNITRLRLHDNLIDCVDNGKTSNGYVIDITVATATQYNNKSTQAIGSVMTNNASTKLGISGATKMTTGTHTSLTTLPATSSVTLKQLADFVATLSEAQKDGLMQA